MPVSTEQILTITRDMHAAAETGDWDRLNTLEHTRSELFSSIFSQQSSSGGHTAQTLIPMIQTVLELDQKIISLCSDESLSCKQQISDFNKGRKAIASYHRFSG